MLKVLKFNTFWISYASLLIVLSFKIFFVWAIMLGILFGLFFIFRLTKLEEKLIEDEARLYLYTVLIYPLVETSIKAMLQGNIIPYSWFWLNRLEHFFWAFATVIILLPLFIDIWKSLQWWQSLLFIIGLICLVGNLNEFFEYFLRIQAGFTSNKLFAAYYWDTIYDMMINIMGGLIGFITLRWKIKML